MDEEEIQMSDKELMWVHPNFKKMMKKKAADNSTSIINISKEMSNRVELPQKQERRGKSAFQRFKL